MLGLTRLYVAAIMFVKICDLLSPENAAQNAMQC